MFDEWRVLSCSLNVPINLSATLGGGQSFRWKHDKISDEWIGIFKKTLWKIRQNESGLSYKILGSLKRKVHALDETNDNLQLKVKIINDSTFYLYFDRLLKDYFKMDIDIQPLYRTWSESDKLFATAVNKFNGIRILSQEPVENLFSFICSSNNNIPRITSLVEKLCLHYGDKICEENGVDYYTFPTIDRLTSNEVESHLKTLKFGYRAKFIYQTAQKIKSLGGNKWLKSLSTIPYIKARDELCNLPGVGRKIADCVCLMSLNHMEAVPVDTHVFQIASKYYLKSIKSKTVTPKIYDEIGDYFRNIYGSYAGWGQAVLFCSDLKMFKQDDKSTKAKLRKKYN